MQFQSGVLKVELSIIIVNWNGGDYLRRSLDSLAKYPPSVPYEVIVVDNDSTDGSHELLRSYKDVRLILNTENLGFGRANNQAFKVSDAPLLFLLNSDAEVHENTLDTLVATINESEEIGAVGPRLLNTDGTLQPSVWRNPPTSWEMIVIAFGLYKLLPKRQRGERLLGYHWDHSHRLSARMISAAALLLKRKVLEDVGGFDERFHMYGEDNEFSLRMVRSGWHMLFEPKATVTHHAAKSSEKRWSELERRAMIYEGSFRLQRIHLSRSAVLANLITGYGLATLRGAWLTLRRRPREENRMIRRLYSDELRRWYPSQNPLPEPSERSSFPHINKTT